MHMHLIRPPAMPRLPAQPSLLLRGCCLLLAILLHGALLLAANHKPVGLLPPATLEPVTITLIASMPVSTHAPSPEPMPPAPPLKATTSPAPPPVSASAPEPDAIAAGAPAALSPSPPPTDVADAKPVTGMAQWVAGYLNNPAPVYPKLSRHRKEEGVVLLRALVLPNGDADHWQVLVSSGFVRLDEAALRAVKRWQFAPAKRGDVVVSTWVQVPVRFTLNG